jgi:hypothetical protein
MFNWQATLGVITGFLSLVCFVPYVITILQGKTKPNRATWWVWAINGSILCASYYLAGAFNTIWIIVGSVIAQFTIAILSLKYGEGGCNRFDRTCLFGVGIAISLWWRFNSPLIAIVLTVAIDLLGALPTIKKSYHEPEKEDFLTWALYLVASLLNLLTIEHWSPHILAPPVYLVCLNIVIVALLLRPKMQAQSASYNQHKRKRIS